MRSVCAKTYQKGCEYVPRKRTALKVFRVKNHLTQQQAAEKIGVTRNTYLHIEYGTRAGTMAFWLKVQNAFQIPDSEMWGLIKYDNMESDINEETPQNDESQNQN